MSDEPRWMKDAPTVGSKWRARRRGEEARTVAVEKVDESFVYTRTLTNTWGEPPARTTHTRVRASRFHYEFDAIAGTSS